MTDIFISYSRKDIAYARLLHEAIKENGFETWIDWQDIPPSTDWLQEVYGAIEQADTFIFVLSASSSLSEICKLEIEHARKNNKRLIPIVINDVNPSSVHPALAAINWIFSRTNDEFQPAIADLITAIKTDYEWVKAHTRLQMRALEWERANNDKSFLLRGSDLSQAEEWFSKAAEKTPEPSLLQTQYLQTSRQEAVKRQRNLLLGVGLALVVTVILGVIAMINGQRAETNAVSLSTQVVVAQNAEATAEQEAYFRATQQMIAEEQKAIAEEQRNIAIARQLTSEAINEVDQEYDLPLLLSLEAHRLSKGATWASGNLLAILQKNPGIAHTLRNHTDIVDIIAFSPDGKTLASGSYDQTIILWDVSNPDVPRQRGQPLVGHTGAIYSLAFSPDGKTLVSGSHDRTILLWDVSNPDVPKQLGQPLIGHTSNVMSLSYSPKGNIFASGGHDKTIILWDVSNIDTPQKIGERITGHSDSVLSLAFSPDGQLLASGGQKKEIILWDLSQPSEPQQIFPILIGHKSDIISVNFSPDGMVLASASSDSIILWDIQNPYEARKIGQPITTDTSCTNLTISPDGGLIASSHSDGNIFLWDISTPDKPKQFGQPLTGHTGWVNSVAFSPDGGMLASSGTYDHNIILWDVNELGEPKRQVLNGHSDSVLSVDFFLILFQFL